MALEKITFYFDFTCPYSYLGWELLKQAGKNRLFEIKFIDVGPDFPGNPRILNRDLWSDTRWEGLKKLGRQIGITINKPSIKQDPTVARRGLYLYEGTGLVEYISGVFEAYFRYGVDIAKLSALIEHLQTNAIDYQPLSQANTKPETLLKMQEDTLLWGHKRIRTLPTLQFENERLAGLFDQRGILNFLNIAGT